MAQLPVPPLDTTLPRLIDWVRPIVNENTLHHTQAAVEEFAKGDGQILQQKLEAYAAECAPDSWLIDAWREANLANRESLPLSTNVVMRVEWKATQTGTKRVAHFVNALLQVHANYRLNGPIIFEDPRSKQPFCAAQQRILAGASRRPHLELDTYVFDDINEQTAHIIVMCKGYAWQVEVIDAKGGIASPAQLDNVFHQILSAYEQDAEIPFGAPSVLPAIHASEIRAQLISRGDNSDVWQNIEKALFTLSLDETHFPSSDGALADTLFNDGSGIWAYKPLNYRCYVNDERYFVHFEHTWTDAGTIFDIISLAQTFYDAQDCPRKNQLPADLGIKPLEWHVEDKTRLILKEHLSDYIRRAETFRVRRAELMISEADQQVLANYSKDAICQIVLQYAQYAAFNEIKSTYEAVDMRHFESGRTECLRPVTVESVAFVKALYEGNATQRQFIESVDEHKNRVKACKRGEGVHRHMLGLAMEAKKAGIDAALFKDPGYLMLGEDTFSTTSLGSHAHIGIIAFAPTQKDGFGINYTALRNHLSFVVTYRRSNTAQVERLVDELESGLKRLLLLLRSED